METVLLCPTEFTLKPSTSGLANSVGQPPTVTGVFEPSIWTAVEVRKGSLFTPCRGRALTERLLPPPLMPLAAGADSRRRFGLYDELKMSEASSPMLLQQQKSSHASDEDENELRQYSAAANNTKSIVRHCNWVRFLRTSQVLTPQVNIIGRLVTDNSDRQQLAIREPVFEVVSDLGPDSELLAFLISDCDDGIADNKLNSLSNNLLAGQTAIGLSGDATTTTSPLSPFPLPSLSESYLARLLPALHLIRQTIFRNYLESLMKDHDNPLDLSPPPPLLDPNHGLLPPPPIHMTSIPPSSSSPSSSLSSSPASSLASSLLPPNHPLFFSDSLAGHVGNNQLPLDRDILVPQIPNGSLSDSSKQLQQSLVNALNITSNNNSTKKNLNARKSANDETGSKRRSPVGGGRPREAAGGSNTTTGVVRRSKTMLPCDTCGKVFDRPSLLKRHIRVHTGEKPHVCDICSKGFSTSSSLNTHRRIHTGEKPHKCDMCGKTFTASSNLYYHKMTHIKEKPHKCRLCSKSFPTPGDLKSHMYVHTGTWPYKCVTCGRGFSKHTNLKNHMQMHASGMAMDNNSSDVPNLDPGEDALEDERGSDDEEAEDKSVDLTSTTAESSSHLADYQRLMEQAKLAARGDISDGGDHQPPMGEEDDDLRDRSESSGLDGVIDSTNICKLSDIKTSITNLFRPFSM